MNAPDQQLKIDVDAVLRAKAPRYYRWIPKGVIRFLERTVCQNRLNELLEHNASLRGADFCRGVLGDLNVHYTVEHADRLPADPRVIIACNHPLGGLDGLILIDYFTRRYGREVRFLVNDILMAVEPLSDVFVPVNKHGRQSRGDAASIDRILATDTPVIIFPAGLCSRKGKRGVVADGQWQKTFITKAIASQRPVIPIRFSGENSKFFYNFAKWRKRLGIPLNIEMVLLPKEMLRAQGRSYTICIGEQIAWQSLRGGRQAFDQAQLIRQYVYSIK